MKYAIYYNSDLNQYVDIKKLYKGYQCRTYFFIRILGERKILDEKIVNTKKEVLQYKKGYKLTSFSSFKKNNLQL